MQREVENFFRNQLQSVLMAVPFSLLMNLKVGAVKMFFQHVGLIIYR